MNFNGRNGTAWYGDQTNPYSSYDSASARTINLDGIDLIDYCAHNVFVWTGLRADFIPHSRFVISLSSEVAVLWFFMDDDYHKLNNKHFKETALSAFYGFRQKLNLEFSVTKIFAVGADFAFVFTGESVGSSMSTKGNSGSQGVAGQGGGQLLYFDLGISAKLRW